MTTNETVRTLPLGVALLREESTGSRWHIIMAHNMFVVVPMLVTFPAAQHHIIRAFTFTSPKQDAPVARPTLARTVNERSPDPANRGARPPRFVAT